VVERRAQHQAPPEPRADLLLHQRGEDLEHEEPAHDREEHLLAQQERHHRDRAADGERPGVAEEELGGKGVAPEEAEYGADQRRAEDHQLLRAGEIGEEQVAREHRVAQHVGEDHVDRQHRGGRAAEQAVHAVGHVHRVDDREDREDGEEEEAEGAQVGERQLEKRHEQVRPQGRRHRARVGDEQPGEGDDEGEQQRRLRELSEAEERRLEAHLERVVDEAHEPEVDEAGEHEQQLHAVEVPPEERRGRAGEEHEQAAAGGRALLRVGADREELPRSVAQTVAVEEDHRLPAEGDREAERGGERHESAEGHRLGEAEEAEVDPELAQGVDQELDHRLSSSARAAAR